MERWSRRLLPLLSLILIALLAPSAAADTTAAAHVEIGWQVLPYQSLAVENPSSTSSGRFRLGQPTPADLSLGYAEADGAVTLVAASNVPWSVKVHAVETDLGRSADGTSVKPLSDFLLRANGGAYLPISTVDQTLASGAFGVTSLVVDCRILTNSTSYRPGDYGLTLVYTITTQD